jgi:biopolymer transport protein TolR
MGFAVNAGGSKKGATPQMNITPLVDVVLVLLIIFMVVTPLLSKTFALHLPKKDDAIVVPPSTTDAPIVLNVTKQGRTLINAHEFERGELVGQLQTFLAAKRDKVVYFDAEDGTPYATAVEVMDLARGGGATTVAILTDSLKP